MGARRKRRLAVEDDRVGYTSLAASEESMVHEWKVDVWEGVGIDKGPRWCER